MVRQGGKRVLLEPGKAYQWALDQAELEVLSGAAGYNQAISRAVRELAAGGVKKVRYESGHVDQIDVAARRAVMTGVGQTCDRYTEQAIESLGTDLVEVSAHGGARSTGSGPENHASWQGKVYRWARAPGRANALPSKGSYPDFERVTGYGTGPGLGGWNCRHRFFPFVEGVSQRAYTDRELREIDPRPFVYQGRTYNAYEATQKQREIERTVRRLAREQKAFEAAGLSEDAQAASIRARRLRKEYREFSATAGLKTQPERMKALYVDELMDTPKSARIKTEKNVRVEPLVQTIGKIDKSKYGGITDKIRSETLVLTDHQKRHIIERRGKDFFEKYSPYFRNIAEDPDYIFVDKAHENTAIASSTITVDGTNINLVIRLAIESDDVGLENSIITAIIENEKRYRQRLRNNTPVYKRE